MKVTFIPSKPEIEEISRRFAAKGYGESKTESKSHDKDRVHITYLLVKKGAT
jgi:hypothetical protein